MLAALPVVLVLLGEPVRRVLGLPPVVATAVGDLTQCVVAVAATAACALRARAGRRRREAGTSGWALLALALAGFAEAAPDARPERKLRGRKAPITLTLPPELIRRLDAAAARDRRSRASMMEILLDDGLRRDGT